MSMKKKNKIEYKEIKKEETLPDLEMNIEDDSIFQPQIDLSIIKVHPGKQEIIMIPPAIELLKTFSMMEVTIKWWKATSQWFMWFSFFWTAVTILIIVLSLFSGNNILLFSTIPFAILGLIMFYSGICYLVNRTYITVDSQKISIEHRPMKFLDQKDQHFPSDQVRQLFVTRYKVANKKSPVYEYAVELKLKSNKTVRLINQLKTSETAEYIEQQIEHFLEIKDRKIKKEYSKK